MKKITLILVLLAIFFTATAQTKLSIFDDLQNVTFENHVSKIPVNFQHTFTTGQFYTYTNETGDLLTFRFKDKKLVSLYTLSKSLIGPRDYIFDNSSNSELIQGIYRERNTLLVKEKDFRGTKYIFYSTNWVDAQN